MELSRVEWCDRCSRLVTEEAVAVDKNGVHRCPLCRSPLRQPSKNEGDEVGVVEERAKAPWHFKFLVVATVGYLIYRTIWIIQRLTHHG